MVASYRHQYKTSPMYRPPGRVVKLGTGVVVYCSHNQFLKFLSVGVSVDICPYIRISAYFNISASQKKLFIFISLF